MSAHTRRSFLRAAGGGAAAVVAAGKISSAESSPQAEKPVRITGAMLGKAIRYPESHGDIWTSTWADDGNLYSISDDTQGFDKACNSNLAFHRIEGGIPPELHGITVNPMKQFGGWAEANPEDLADWKACGVASIDGVLYMSVSRNLMQESPWIQQTWDASIIKSTDHGRTWSEPPSLNHAMFPGRVFSTPFFVQYGKDGSGGRDGADKYVYAVSNDGAWNNGNWMTLGRVLRERLPRLNANDWEFVHGFTRGEPVWRPRCESALLIFRNPGKTSMTGIHYVAPLGLYIMPQWYYTHLEDDHRRWKATCFEFYQSPKPWGPWTLFHTQTFEPEGWYNPCIPSKFISADDKSMWIFCAGDWTTAETTHGLYGLWMMPLQFEIEAVKW